MRLKRFLLSFAMPLFFSLSWLATEAQERSISGRITDAASKGIPGVSITVKDQNVGTQTDAEGAFRLNVPAGATTLIFSSVGFQTQEVDISNTTTVTLVLNQNTAALNEVVVVGYGTARKKDLTGSVTSISSRDFNRGPVTTPEQLIAGKVAGVQITSNGGAPGAGSRIRIRGGSSLNASNDPLIVIDGVPVDNGSISGSANPLNFINPNDIESFNILKDASATAIYGSRASNGVIIITTKKGARGPLRVNFSTVNSIAERTGKVDVLTADQFRQVVTENGTAAQAELLGGADTDWQDEIFQKAFTTDNNISVSGAVGALPFRVSVGYLSQKGILLTSKLNRTSGALNLSPKFLDNHLSIDLNLKLAQSKTRFADQGAIGAAVAFDPTKPVFEKSNTDLGGYWEWLDPATDKLNTLGTRNPVSMLKQRQDNSDAFRSIGNIQFDYKLHFLPALRANLNLGFDHSKGEGTVVNPATAATAYYVRGSRSQYEQEKNNKLLEFYLNYAKELPGIESRFDVTAGYSYQDWTTESPSFPVFRGTDTTPAAIPFKTQNTLVSFFGRANYNFDDRFLVTATLRRDGSSRFSPDTRWGLFPSAAFAWRISNEGFLKNSKSISDLKFRLGYGVTGQQDINNGDYPYLPRYTLSDGTAQYGIGDSLYNTLRPEGYDLNIKWEETETYNAGLDFGFLDNRISGSIDYYFKKTKDLLAVISVPAGSNLTNRVLTNVGNIENRGIELVLNGTPVQTKDFRWDAGFNITYNKTEITKLSKIEDKTFIGYESGTIGGGVGNNIQINTVGYNPYAFYVYKQVYDESGRPIEGVYVDMNKDGVITDRDKYRYKSAEPTMFLGFSSQFSYKKWFGSFTLRGSFNNYVYNNFSSNNGAYKAFSFPNYLSNVSTSVLDTRFDEFQLFSDYYLENASFLRADNINVGYNFGRLWEDKVGVRVTATVNNAFTITKYSGLDPEIAGGIDNNFYPRPRIFSLGVNLDF